MKGIFNQHQVHVLRSTRFDCKDAKDFHNKTVRVFFVMFSEGRKHAQHQVHFTFRHSLNNKLSIVAKEKEASAPSCTFSCFKDLVTIGLRTQTLFNNFHITEVIFESRHEEVSFVKCHLNI